MYSTLCSINFYPECLQLMFCTLKKYRIRQNFRGGKLSRLCTKHTIHWKTFAVHQAHAIIYCTQQMVQGENFHDWLKNRENRESFPPRKFCRIRYQLNTEEAVLVWKKILPADTTYNCGTSLTYVANPLN